MGLSCLGPKPLNPRPQTLNEDLELTSPKGTSLNCPSRIIPWRSLYTVSFPKVHMKCPHGGRGGPNLYHADSGS